MLIGTLAALAALGICRLTSSSLSPAGGGLLGLVAGLTGGGLSPPREGPRSRLAPLASGLVAAATAAAVVLFLQR